MSAFAINDLPTTLLDVSRLYPEMRLGQLVEMLTTLASDEVATAPAELEDHRLATVAENHIAKRLSQLGCDRVSLADCPLSPGRVKLVQAISKLQHQREAGHFAKMLMLAAISSDRGLYEIEDDELLAIVHSGDWAFAI